jgi:hypothetical protein
MKLDPVSLRLFVAVMEESTIAAAAAREHLAASAVSRRLADLEDALQVTLFTRSHKGTEPTAAAPRGSAALYRGTLPVLAATLNEPWAQRRLALCGRAEESPSSAARLRVDHPRNPPRAAATP